jgi:roadblock/LC7 domain-containing protein
MCVVSEMADSLRLLLVFLLMLGIGCVASDITCPPGADIPEQYRQEIRLVDLEAPRTISIRMNGESTNFVCDYVRTDPYAPTTRVFWDSRNSTFFFIPFGLSGHYFTPTGEDTASNSKLINGAGYFLGATNVERDSCLYEADCAACAARSECGWCSFNRVCMTGGALQTSVPQLAAQCNNASWDKDPLGCSLCEEGYYGVGCNMWDCYRAPRTSSKVCGGVGACVSPNDCDCTDTLMAGDECKDGSVSWYVGCGAAREDTSRGNLSHPETAQAQVLSLRSGEIVEIQATLAFRDADLLWTVKQIAGNATVTRLTTPCGMRVITSGGRLPSAHTSAFRVTSSGDATFAVVTYGTSGSYYDASLVVKRLDAFSMVGFGQSCQSQRLQPNGPNQLVGSAEINVPALHTVLVIVDVSARATNQGAFSVGVIGNTLPAGRVEPVSSCRSAFDHSSTQSGSHIALFRSLGSSRATFYAQVTTGSERVDVDAVSVVARVIGSTAAELAVEASLCTNSGNNSYIAALNGSSATVLRFLDASAALPLQPQEWGVIHAGLSVDLPDLTWLMTPRDNHTDDASGATCEQLVTLPSNDVGMWRAGVFQRKNDEVLTDRPRFGITVYGNAGNFSSASIVGERLSRTLPAVWLPPASKTMRFVLAMRPFVARELVAGFGKLLGVEPFMFEIMSRTTEDGLLVVDIQIRGSPFSGQYTPDGKVTEATDKVENNDPAAQALGINSLIVDGKTYRFSNLVSESTQSWCSTLCWVGIVAGGVIVLCMIVVIPLIIYRARKGGIRRSKIDALVEEFDGK